MVEPRGEAREEWEVIDAISRRVGFAPYSAPGLRALAKLGIRLSPQRLVDMLLRIGPDGDLFGVRRGGLSVEKLRREHPHGLVLSDHVATGVLRKKIRTRSKRLELAPPAIVEELARVASSNGDDPNYPLRLIGLRELRSHNSWMHNAPLLMRGGRVHALRVHPDDAAAHGLEDGGEAVLESKSGSLTVPVKVTDEMTPRRRGAPARLGAQGRLAVGQ